MELGHMNGSVGGSGGAAGGGGGGSGSGSGAAARPSSGDDGEMPAVHEIGEELVWTGRCPPHLTVILLPFPLVPTSPTL